MRRLSKSSVSSVAVVFALAVVIVFQQSSLGQPKEVGGAKAEHAKTLKWNYLPSDGYRVKRAKVPGGWFVAVANSIIRSESDAPLSTFFYPDPHHEWDGTSLPR